MFFGLDKAGANANGVRFCNKIIPSFKQQIRGPRDYILYYGREKKYELTFSLIRKLRPSRHYINYIICLNFHKNQTAGFVITHTYVRL